MSRRNQHGSVEKRNGKWWFRYREDVAGEKERTRVRQEIGPCVGPNKLTRSEAERQGAAILEAKRINAKDYLSRLEAPVMTFHRKVEWCRQYHKAWIDGRPGPVKTLESQLRKHILPRFGDLPLDLIDEMRVQEFIADLKKGGKLSRKTISNIVGVVKLIVGRKVWLTWELDLGRPEKPKQRYYTEEQMQQIVGKAVGQYQVLFVLLAGSGLRIGEAAALRAEDVDLPNCVIRVRRSFSETGNRYLPPKTEAGNRDVDIDTCLSEVLRFHLNGRATGLVFQSATGTPLRAGNVIKRVLNPILDQLGIKRGGKVLHAFRHGRTTMLRKMGTPGDLQKLWLGHSSLQVTDRYSHTDQELEYRRAHASRVVFNVPIGPNGPN